MAARHRSLLALAGTLLALIATSALASAEPLTVSLPTLEVDARVERVSVENGQLGTPVDPDDVGGYQLPGNLLLVGHVDWAGSLRAFSGVRWFAGGEPVLLSDGRSYHIVWTRSWAIDDTDAWAEIASPSDEDVLTLLTCTGVFDHERHEYLERFAARAVRDN